LTEDEILEAALHLVEADGTARLSMRRLADKLGVTPMAIYRHVPGKEELLERLGQNVLQRVKVDDSGSWQDQLLANTLRTWKALRNYPGLATYLLDRPFSEEARRKAASVIGLLEDAGFERESAEMAWEAYHTYTYGLVVREAKFPSTRQPLSKRERTVEFGMRIWLAGLEAQLDRRKEDTAD
jgi:AcrR family transcriptional regulator